MIERTTVGSLTIDHETVLLRGWAQRSRDFGGLVFIDLRDRSGVIQCVFNPEEAAEAHAVAREIGTEYVIEIEGAVARRPEGTENPSLSTGQIEVRASAVRVLNTSRPLPFDLSDAAKVSEPVRLQYRYLDLRRTEMRDHLKIRHQFNKATREFLTAAGFWEVETPILMKSTPEGARDFLVPSRQSPGCFYALPQSPQLLKQVLMVGGVEKYFQIARCFRDEDSRSDRQPEFTQVDVEMSFVDREDVLTIMERAVAYVFQQCTGVEVPLPLPRLTFHEAMDRYGIDRPDRRYGLELTDLTEVVAGSGFRVFAAAGGSGEVVKGLRVPGGGAFSRKQVDDLEVMAKSFGAAGLVWIYSTAEGARSPIAKFLGAGEANRIFERLGAEVGDLVLIVAGPWRESCEVLGRLREHLGEKLDLVDTSRHDFHWIIDFPAFEFKDGAYSFNHNPVSAPQEQCLEDLEEGLRYLRMGADAPLPPGSEKHPLAQVLSKQYDMVMDGHEIAGGSIRIHRSDLQLKIFEIMGLTVSQAWERFGFLLTALEFGAPPHGGIAWGADRIIAEMVGSDNIREVIAFPKNNNGADLMMQAPSPVDDTHLRDLRLKLLGAQEGS